MKKGLFFAVIVLIAALLYTVKQNKTYKEKWKVAIANVKAYSDELSDSKNKNTAFQLTIDQLKTYQDSVLIALNETKKELKIKDKKLQSLQYVSSSFTKIDTLLMRDTLFKEPSFAIDTTIQDKWYKLKLGLRYPSMIVVNPEFKSEKHIIVSTKKETVNPPKKFFLFRWFQKKHTILHVDVVEKNPYVNDESSKYVEILK